MSGAGRLVLLASLCGGCAAAGGETPPRPIHAPGPTSNAAVTAHIPLGGRILDVTLFGMNPIDPTQAARIVAALNAGTVSGLDGLPRIDAYRITSMERPPDLAVEVAGFSRAMARWDDSVVEVIIPGEQLCICLSVSDDKIVCVGAAGS